MRRTVHLDFNGNRDLLFDFFRGVAGPLSDDLNVIVRHIRVGFDRQVMKGDRSPGQEQHGDNRPGGKVNAHGNRKAERNSENGANRLKPDEPR